MKHLKYIALSLIVATLLGFSMYNGVEKSNKKHVCTNTWGFFGHKKINRMAVFTLPPELFPLYKKHIDFITDHSVDPDKRRYAVEGEAERHYIDIDHYVKPGEDPFDIMPKHWNDAVAKFTEDTLKAYGIIPWHLNTMLYRLTEAFKQKNLNRILRLSAEIGHYVGDAHVPLHTTKNYNGQMTNQRGIHGFWESRLPELFSENYDLFVGQATLIEKPLDVIWDIIKQSHYAVDSVLGFERELTKEFDSDRKYSFEQRGAVMMKTYSREFSDAYHKRLDNMVERRMHASILSIGNFWYTAWHNAGKPNIKDIMGEDFDPSYHEFVVDSSNMKKINTREHEN
jgi:hypothetical protein